MRKDFTDTIFDNIHYIIVAVFLIAVICATAASYMVVKQKDEIGKEIGSFVRSITDGYKGKK